MNVLSLCTGICGFEWAGRLVNEALGREFFVPVAFSEIDPYCVEVERHYFPEVAQLGAIQNVSNELIRRGIAFECLVGGIPCQPYSHAGQRMGASDTRDLWPITHQIIQRHRPRWVCIENVSGFAGSPDGLLRVAHDLESEGYSVGSVEIPACAVGASHERMRTFVLAHSDSLGSGCGAKCHFSSDDHEGARPQSCGSGRIVADSSCQQLEESFDYGGEVERRSYGEFAGPSSSGERTEALANSQGSGDRGSIAASGDTRPIGTNCERQKATNSIGICDSDGGGRFVAHTDVKRTSTELSGETKIINNGGDGFRPSLADAEECGVEGSGRLRNEGVREHGEEGLPERERANRTATNRASQSGLGSSFDAFAASILRRATPVALMGEKQYPWEPPRLASKGPRWKQELSALGNAVVPYQAAMPLLALALSELSTDEPSGAWMPVAEVQS